MIGYDPELIEEEGDRTKNITRSDHKPANQEIAGETSTLLMLFRFSRYAEGRLRAVCSSRYS